MGACGPAGRKPSLFANGNVERLFEAVALGIAHFHDNLAEAFFLGIHLDEAVVDLGCEDVALTVDAIHRLFVETFKADRRIESGLAAGLHQQIRMR